MRTGAADAPEPGGPLARLPRGVQGRPAILLVAGKGGVGKTTVAASLALRRAQEGRETLLLSVDPAHSLGDVLDVAVGPDPHPVPGAPRLQAMEVIAETERRRFLDAHRDSLRTLLERGTYLDSDDASGLADLAIPGMDELAALLRLRELLDGEADLVVDAAPTGHTLRLLDLPALARAWLDVFRAMGSRDRAVSSALVGAHRVDESTRLLERLDRRIAEVESLLRDAQRCAIVLVTTRDPVVLAETLRYQEELSRRRLRVAGVVVNREESDRPQGSSHIGDRMIPVPELDPEPIGLPGLERFGLHLFGDLPATPTGLPAAAGGRLDAGRVFLPPADRRLYLVAGKGGVGKSTAAAALAVRLQQEGRSVLLLGVDPAGSLGEVLEQKVTTVDRPVDGAPGMRVRQLDPTRSWEEFRAGYRAEAERVFSGIMGGAAVADRQLVERMADLAPPGLDELSALMEVIDATEVRPYDALVVDNAPTGHFLRLLELPGVALEWVHEVMRLLLKYREVVAPGVLAERLLELARSLRRFQRVMQDASECWVLLVALPEALSVPETVRAGARLAALGIQPGALLLNRVLRGDGAMAGSSADGLRLAVEFPDLPLIGAPALAAGPAGVDALRQFSEQWRHLRLGPVKPMEGRI